jgi:hypothetical protein
LLMSVCQVGFDLFKRHLVMKPTPQNTQNQEIYGMK